MTVEEVASQLTQRISPALGHWFASCVERNSENEAVTVLLSDEGQEALDGLVRLIESAAAVVGVEAREVLPLADFKPHDFTEENFNSVLAELRTVMFLHRERFSSIRLLPSNKQSPQCDLIADRAGSRFAIEVKLITSATFQYPGHAKRRMNLSQRLKDEATKAMSGQLAPVSMKSQRCDLRMIVIAVDSPKTITFTQPRQLMDSLVEAYKALEDASNFHIALITGMADSGGMMYCYPEYN